MPAPLAIVLPVRFHEAIRSAERRRVVLSDAYYGEIQAAARSQAFTISGVASAIQLRQALDAMNEGLRQGMSFGEWKAKAAEMNWSLPESRLDLILRAHTQTAYNAGHWEQIERVKDRRGFIMYSAINDSRTRPSHRAMDGIIRPADDTFWDHHSPPCGFNCRCGVISLTEEQAVERGGVTEQIPTEAGADPGWGAKPVHGGRNVDQQVAREQIVAPTPLQEAIRIWHERLQADKIRDNVMAFVRDFADTYNEIEHAVRDLEGVVSDYEAVALHKYTQNFSGVMNDFLRGMNPRPTPGLTSTTVAAVQALGKMTPYEGTVVRGFFLEGVKNPAAWLEAHRAGEVIEYQGFTSASWRTPFPGNVQMRILSRTGRDVTPLSAFESEMEVLFPPSTKFRVTKAETVNGTLFVELEELADQGVVVPQSHRFSRDAWERMKAGETIPADELASTAAQSLVAREAAGADPDDLEKFKLDHDGLTPIQWAIAQHPTAAVDIAETFPHLLPED